MKITKTSHSENGFVRHFWYITYKSPDGQVAQWQQQIASELWQAAFVDKERFARNILADNVRQARLHLRAMHPAQNTERGK